MLFALVGCVLSRWETHHLGNPVISRVRDDKLVLNTTDGILALLNATTGQIFWRRKFPDIVAFDYANTMVAVSDSHYLHLLDSDSGLVINTTKHNLTQVLDITAKDLSIAVLGPSELQLYANGTLSWSTSVSSATHPIEFTDNALNCGGYSYNIETGDRLDRSPLNPIARPEITFKWTPTVLEAFASDRPLWRIDEPLYNSTLLGFAPRSHLLFKNDTHFFLFDFFHERIPFIRAGTIFSFAQQTDRFVLDTSDGLFLLFGMNGTLIPYQDDAHRVFVENITVQGTEKLFAFPSGVSTKCAVASQAGGAISVAADGPRLLIAVVNYTGRLSSIGYIEDATVGTCWSYDDSLSVSYYKAARNTSYVSSWSAANMTHKTYTTERLVLAAGRDHFALSNGQILGVEGATVHGALQTTTTEGHYTYRPDITGYTMEIAVENAKVVVDAFSSLVVQGYDVLVLEGGMTWVNVYAQLACVGVMVAGAIFVGLWTWWTESRKFWS
jgi:hypothetical protein